MLLFLNLFPSIQNKPKECDSQGLFYPRVGGPTRTMDRTDELLGRKPPQLAAISRNGGMAFACGYRLDPRSFRLSLRLCQRTVS